MKTITAVFFLIAIHMNVAIIQSSGVYPNSLIVSNPTADRQHMPKACLMEGTSYCFEKGDDYPQEEINDLLKNITNLYIEMNEYDEIDQREGDANPDCPSLWTNNPIYYIIDKHNSVRVVVQSPGIFEQLYTVRWCIKEGQIRNETTHFLFSTTLKNHRMECVNMRMNYDFFVLGYDKDSLEKVQAKDGIPVCCRCRQMD